MSASRIRIAAFCGAVELLVGAGAYFVLGDEEAPQAAVQAASGPSGAPGAHHPGSAQERVLAAIERHERDQEIARARRLDPTEHHHAGPRRRDLRRLELAGVLVERVGREFFAAFARYELGELDRAIATKLRATATTAFARELLAAPPRLPVGAEAPNRAELGAVEFVAGDSDPERLRLTTAELVGYVRRGPERTPVAIELRNTEGGWRVGGLGR